ncbi:MAG: polysaccharide biosynthesis protein, partial [Leifsonia xyli]
MIDRFMASPARRTGLQVALDALVWVVAIVFAVSLRYDFSYDAVTWTAVLGVATVTVLLGAALGYATGLYRRRFVPGSFAEVRTIMRVVVVTGIAVGVPVLVFGTEIMLARSTMLIALPVAFVFMGALRYVARLYVDSQHRPGEGAQPTLIFGAGRLANHLIRRMLTDPESPYLPVGLIDDDPSRAGLRIEGVHVVG